MNNPLENVTLKSSLFEENEDDLLFQKKSDNLFEDKVDTQSNEGREANRRLSYKSSSRYSVKERLKVTTDTEDPLSQVMLNSYEPVIKITKENLTIRKEDEARVVAGLRSAAKKQTTGAIYSVVVDLSKTGTLGIGVKDLPESVLAVSMLKRENGCPGAGEEAGIRLGDIVFGVNFIPTREGSKTLIGIIKKEALRGKTHVHIQGWRCHQLCSDAMPGYQFPRADEVLVQAYSLVQSTVFSDWERWNFIEILLGHMLEDLRMRTNEENGLGDSAGSLLSPSVALRAKQMQVLDLERNILQAKGLRTALCVRIVHTKSHGDTVVYVLRVEDVESGLQWVVQRRYSDFYALNEELLDMTHFTKEVEFPRKRLSIRNTAKLVEMRIVALEQYMRRMLHILTLYATMDSSASKTLRHLQTFLGVDNYLDCVHPPILDDQRYIELMAYRFLNDFHSEACQQCVRFITTVDLESMIEIGPEGYLPVLNYMRDALIEVEQFVQQQHLSQMIDTLSQRRIDLNSEQLTSFVKKCIRRQVEAALYLPLRRTIFRIVFTFLTEKSKKLQKAILLLQRASPKFLMVDPFVTRAAALPRTVKAFRRVIQAYLPADQGQLLIQAANAVTELHKECQMERNRLAAATSTAIATAANASTTTGATATATTIVHNNNQTTANMTVTSIDEQPIDLEVPIMEESISCVPAMRSGSDEVDFNYISTKTPDLHIGIGIHPTLSDDRSRVGGVEELPEPFKRPIVNKLRDLFTRKKTSEDLFANSDSDNEENTSLTAQLRTASTLPSEENCIPRPYSSAPNTPPRPKFIQRLIPRPLGSGLKQDTADNLFVDERQAFTVSVKSSENGSNQDSSHSPMSSGCTTPRPQVQRALSSGLEATDSDLTTIQRHISKLSASSADGAHTSSSAAIQLSPRASEGLSPRASEGGGMQQVSSTVAAVYSAFPASVCENQIESSDSQQPAASSSQQGENSHLIPAAGPAVSASPIPQQHDPAALLLSVQAPALIAAGSTGRVLGWDDNSSSSSTNNSAAVTPSTLSTAGASGHSRAILENLVMRNAEHKSSQYSLPSIEQQDGEEREENGRKGLKQQYSFSSQQYSGGETPLTVSESASADELYLKSQALEEEMAIKDHLAKVNEREDSSPREIRSSIVINNSTEEAPPQYDAISADDFLPLFTFVLIQAGLPQLLLVKELMTALVNDEDSYGECGYYLATLEAATQHIFDLADQYTAELAQSAEGRSLEEASGEEALLDGAFEEKLLLH